MFRTIAMLLSALFLLGCVTDFEEAVNTGVPYAEGDCNSVFIDETPELSARIQDAEQARAGDLRIATTAGGATVSTRSFTGGGMAGDYEVECTLTGCEGEGCRRSGCTPFNRGCSACDCISGDSTTCSACACAQSIKKRYNHRGESLD